MTRIHAEFVSTSMQFLLILQDLLGNLVFAIPIFQEHGNSCPDQGCEDFFLFSSGDDFSHTLQRFTLSFREVIYHTLSLEFGTD